MEHTPPDKIFLKNEVYIYIFSYSFSVSYLPFKIYIPYVGILLKAWIEKTGEKCQKSAIEK